MGLKYISEVKLTRLILGSGSGGAVRVSGELRLTPAYLV